MNKNRRTEEEVDKIISELKDKLKNNIIKKSYIEDGFKEKHVNKTKNKNKRKIQKDNRKKNRSK